MDKATQAQVRRARESGETVDDKLQRILTRRLTAAPTAELYAPQPSLPTDGAVDMITLTLDELHDLVYLATSAINQGSTTMSKAHAQDLAKRAAMLARARATQHDGHHRGSDPRG